MRRLAMSKVFSSPSVASFFAARKEIKNAKKEIRWRERSRITTEKDVGNGSKMKSQGKDFGMMWSGKSDELWVDRTWQTDSLTSKLMKFQAKLHNSEQLKTQLTWRNPRNLLKQPRVGNVFALFDTLGDNGKIIVWARLEWTQAWLWANLIYFQ